MLWQIAHNFIGRVDGLSNFVCKIAHGGMDFGLSRRIGFILPALIVNPKDSSLTRSGQQGSLYSWKERMHACEAVVSLPTDTS
jgi:hypothetical protein